MSIGMTRKRRNCRLADCVMPEQKSSLNCKFWASSGGEWRNSDSRQLSICRRNNLSRPQVVAIPRFEREKNWLPPSHTFLIVKLGVLAFLRAFQIQCDQIRRNFVIFGDFWYSLVTFFGGKSSPKLEQDLGQFLKRHQFCNLGHYDINMGEFCLNYLVTL